MSGTALVTGATGLLGSQVAQAFEARGWSVVGTGLTRASPPSTIKLDLLDAAAIEKALDEVKPDVIVHCAADRSPDSCSTNPAAARALNVDAARTLTAAAARRSIFTLYISTDYVFPGVPGDAPYAPLAATQPPNTYGLTKWEGENAVLAAAAEHRNKDAHPRPLAAALRVPILYGKAGKPSDSAVNCLVEQVRKAAALGPADEKIKMDDYALRYPTNTADVGRVCVDVCALYTGRAEPGPEAPARLPEILHFSSEDCKTKLDMCKVLAGILGVGTEGLEAFRPSEEELKAEERGERVRRPYDCHLDTKETRALGIDCSCVDFAEWWRKELGKA
ncbi:Methionine adenosyltransferase 2 subunit beta [Lasiodiplodia theobromae]|uniref:Methionine adenosyltransferase 2 subunit beta n=1 Tax=Lasiodiplodia theobromae TaxID=45133 RepID=A0A5N5DK50_9PEZI|nr:Methionine adenosyltransferase 2 subunit beta [Lasiodiplodia theobromae]KAB2578243.1 Methionine adenosyltransferase 2 subunit beta [Lasiodiplodia theobromae]KAF4544106.1 Methionine adenosyltransferase 2 subunit beta [Lasiodiplodia theobromae]